MPYDIIQHPKYYKYKVCKGKSKSSAKNKKKTMKKTTKTSTTRRRNTIRKTLGKNRRCFSKKWLTKKKAKAQKTAIILSELGIGRK